MCSLRSKLPEEIISKIQDINCKKNINGDKKSNELILIFDLDKTAEEVHDELLQWLFRCLDTISYKVERGGQYEWNIISGIKDNNYESSLININTNQKIYINSIMVAIHITDQWRDLNEIDNNFTIPFNNKPDIILSPQEIIDCLINEPNFIKNIGVSSVSSETIMYWWEDIISKEPDNFDIPGKGYMVHPMWKKYDNEPSNGSLWGNWSSVREMSFGFEWEGYSPEE